MKSLRSDRGDKTIESSISESPLKPQFKQDFELSATVYTDDDATPSQGETSETKTNWCEQAMSDVKPILSLLIEHLSRSSNKKQIKDSGSEVSGQHMIINVHKTVGRKTKFSNSTHYSTNIVENT